MESTISGGSYHIKSTHVLEIIPLVFRRGKNKGEGVISRSEGKHCKSPFSWSVDLRRGQNRGGPQGYGLMAVQIDRITVAAAVIYDG